MDSPHAAVASLREPGSLPHLYLGLRGRVSRRSFWLHGVAALLGLGLLLHSLLDIARVPADTADAVVNLLLSWPAIAVAVKRWHDRDKSGWWVLIVLLPLIGGLWALFDNGCLRGTVGPNRYGPEPGGQ